MSGRITVRPPVGSKTFAGKSSDDSDGAAPRSLQSAQPTTSRSISVEGGAGGKPPEAIRVAVRVRPFNQREKAIPGNRCVIEMEGANTTVLSTPPKTYTYDFSYWSHDSEESPEFATQDVVMKDIGFAILDNALNGFNGCLFAYGQTGSGKSYSIMGFGENPGIIPRTVDKIFAERETLEEDAEKQLIITISYLEIYNEHLRDLLDANEHESPELKVVDHPKFGIFVPSLTRQAVATPEDVSRLMDYGTKRRVVAATQMNATSSRSHAVFCMSLERLEGPRPAEGAIDTRKVLRAKINLIDLAGSERQSKTGTEGARFKEGCAINQSLSALGMVIKELSENVGKAIAKIPFRTSKLTFILKDSLAGNSKTFMIAAVSPSADNIEDTVATLRFAASVKKIKTVAKQNKDKKDEMIENLKKELEALRAQLGVGGIGEESLGGNLLHDNELLLGEISQTHKCRMERAQRLDKARQVVLQDMSLYDNDLRNALGMDQMMPYMINIADDPSLAGCLLYYVLPGKTTSIGAAPGNTVRLSGIGIGDHLCSIENEDNTVLRISKCGSEGRIVVDGQRLFEGISVQMRHKQKVFLGRAFAMKLIIPSQKTDHETDDPLMDALDDEMAALGDNPAWASLQEQLNEAVHEMQPADARELWQEVKHAVEAVEEAGEITAELRPEEGLEFEVVLTKGDNRNVIVRVFRKEEVVPVMEADPRASFASKRTRTLYLWTVPQMEERLQRMRDFWTDNHMSITRGGTGNIDSICDPWHEVSVSELRIRFTQMADIVEQVMQENHKLRYKKEMAIGKHVCLWQNERDDYFLATCFKLWVTALSHPQAMNRKNTSTAWKSFSQGGLRPPDLLPPVDDPDLAAVSVHITGVDLLRLAPEHREELQAGIVAEFAEVLGVHAEDVRDLQGRPGHVSLSSGSIVAEGHIRASPGGPTFSAIEQVLGSEASRQSLVACVSKAPGVAGAMYGPIGAAYSVRSPSHVYHASLVNLPREHHQACLSRLGHAQTLHPGVGCDQHVFDAPQVCVVEEVCPAPEVYAVPQVYAAPAFLEAPELEVSFCPPPRSRDRSVQTEFVEERVSSAPPRHWRETVFLKRAVQETSDIFESLTRQIQEYEAQDSSRVRDIQETSSTRQIQEYEARFLPPAQLFLT